MDPDLVRQQEEAEREALTAFSKTQAVKTAAGSKQDAAVAPFAPVYFATPDVLETKSETPASGMEEQNGAPPKPARPLREPLYVRFGRFLSYGLAGGILGGSFGVAVFHYWQFPLGQARLVIFGPAGALALLCAFASLFVNKRR